MRWALLPYRRYFEFRGRSRRTEYWVFALAWLMAWITLGVLGRLLLGAGIPAADGFVWLFVLGSFVPGLAVTVRRLHDADRTGWWAALPLTPFLLAFVVIPMSDDLPDAAAMGIGTSALAAPLALFVLLGWKGTTGRNRFGEDPRNPDADLETVFS